MRAAHVDSGEVGWVSEVRTRFGHGKTLWARWATLDPDYRTSWVPLTCLCHPDDYPNIASYHEELRERRRVKSGHGKEKKTHQD